MHPDDFAVGAPVEVEQDGETWRRATVVRRYLYGMHFVEYDDDHRQDWAHAARIRDVAETGGGDDT